MNPKQDIRRAQTEIGDAREILEEPEIEDEIENLSRGALMVARDDRPVQPQGLIRLSIQLDSIIDEATDEAVREHLERAKEHYADARRTIQSEGPTGQ